MFGVGYLAVFTVYVAFGRVFPPGYTYWSLPAGFVAPVVYLFLWLLGVWDLLDIVFHRRYLGRTVRTSLAGFRDMSRKSSTRPGSSTGFAAGRGRTNLRAGSQRFWGRGPATAGDTRLSDVETAEVAHPVLPLVATQTVRQKAEDDAPSVETQTMHPKSESMSPTTSAHSDEARRPPAPPR